MTSNGKGNLMSDTLKAAARAGDPKALEALMNKSFGSRGITVRVTNSGSLLRVLLRGKTAPDKGLLTMIRQGLGSIKPTGFDKVIVTSRAIGSGDAWSEQWELVGGSAGDRAPAPAPLPSKPAVKTLVSSKKWYQKPWLITTSIIGGLLVLSFFIQDQTPTPTITAQESQQESPVDEPASAEVAADLTAVLYTVIDSDSNVIQGRKRIEVRIIAPLAKTFEQRGETVILAAQELQVAENADVVFVILEPSAALAGQGSALASARYAPDGKGFGAQDWTWEVSSSREPIDPQQLRIAEAWLEQKGSFQVDDGFGGTKTDDDALSKAIAKDFGISPDEIGFLYFEPEDYPIPDTKSTTLNSVAPATPPTVPPSVRPDTSQAFERFKAKIREIDPDQDLLSSMSEDSGMVTVIVTQNWYTLPKGTQADIAVSLRNIWRDECDCPVPIIVFGSEAGRRLVTISAGQPKFLDE